MLLQDERQGDLLLCPLGVLSLPLFRQTFMGSEDKVSVNTLCHQPLWMHRIERCRHGFVQGLPPAVPIRLGSVWFCRSPFTSLQACADGQHEPKQDEEGRAPVGIYHTVHGTEEVRQTSDKRVICVQTSSSPSFLQRPMPPDTEGYGDPHRKAAEESDHLWQALSFIQLAAVLFLLPIIVHSTGNCFNIRPQHSDQGLHRDQKRG